MFEYVQDLKLEPARPYALREKTDMIVLHHFASDATPEQVHEYHIKRGHKGIDYNIVVLLSGRAVWGRGLAYEGGHVQNSGVSEGMNARSIGIACQGDFDERTMPKAQKDMLLRIIWDCLRAYPGINRIIGHREVKATACPGRNFPLIEAKTQLQAHKDTISVNRREQANRPLLAGTGNGKGVPAFTLCRILKYRLPHLRGEDVRAVQQELIAQGFSIGVCGADGVFGRRTQKSVKQFQRSRKLKTDGAVGEKTALALGGQWEAEK